MTTWETINQVTEDADKLRELELLYMERGNVSVSEARQWALEQFEKYSERPLRVTKG